MKYDHCAAGALIFPNDIQVHPCKYLVTVMLNQFKVLLSSFIPSSIFRDTYCVVGGVSYCTASFGARGVSSFGPSYWTFIKAKNHIMVFSSSSFV